MKRIFTILVLTTGLAAPARAGGFTFTFDWSGLSRCVTGSPNRVDNPLFRLKNLPQGTKFIRFRLRDRDAPGYNHGGGVVAFGGDPEIRPGAFKYQSPCPPDGRHTYEWTATALSKRNGGALATARVQRKYP